MVYSIPILFFVHYYIFNFKKLSIFAGNTQNALLGRVENTGMNRHKEESVGAIERGVDQVLKGEGGFFRPDLRYSWVCDEYSRELLIISPSLVPRNSIIATGGGQV